MYSNVSLHAFFLQPYMLSVTLLSLNLTSCMTSAKNYRQAPTTVSAPVQALNKTSSFPLPPSPPYSPYRGRSPSCHSSSRHNYSRCLSYICTHCHLKDHYASTCKVLLEESDRHPFDLNDFCSFFTIPPCYSFLKIK